MARIFGLGSAAAFIFATLAVACGTETADGTMDLPPREATQEEEPAPIEEPAPEPKAEEPAPAICNEQEASYEAERPKSNLVFVVDRSGSMKIKLPNGDTRWAATRAALYGILGKLPAMQTRASVMQFPQGDAPITCCSINSQNVVACNCSSVPAPTKRCDAATYKGAEPTELDAAALTSIRTQIDKTNNEFYWGTPLAAATAAGVNLQKASNNDGVKAVILLTDGAPTSCDTTANPDANADQFVIDAAKAGMANGETIRTYVIGVVDGANGNDARPDLLSKVAQAGGTARDASCAANNTCFYSASAANLQADLATAFEKIARDATDCTFELPPATSTTDLGKVNVTLSENGTQTTIARDQTKTDGWDFVDNQSRVKLYGKACAEASNVDVRVKVVLGCRTVTAP